MSEPPIPWAERLRVFTPAWIRTQPALAAVGAGAEILLHGSTTHGIDDPWSDLDVWILVSDAELAALDAAHPTRFFQFTLEGKPGHFNVESRDEFRRRVRRCDFPMIAELRTTRILSDPSDLGAGLLAAAARPMPDDVRAAWFRYHYVEMRSEHRACDNPIERRDPVALLQGLSGAVTHALRAAMILDGEPYPYVKWLGQSAARTPTGSRLSPVVESLLDALAADGLRAPGPEAAHPLSLALREIRRILAETARARGIEGPWLRDWFLYLHEARRGIHQVVW
jgi:hypothetical protein